MPFTARERIIKGLHPCRWHSAANFNILLQCSLFDGPGEWLFSLHRRLPFARFLITNHGDATLLIFLSPSSYALPRYLFDFCLRRHVGPFSIFTSAKCLFASSKWREKYTIAFKEISHCRNFYLSSITFQLLRAVMRARSFWGGKCLLFFFTFHKCRFSFSFPFSSYLLPALSPSFLRFTGYRRTFCGRPWLRRTCVYDSAVCEHLLHLQSLVQLCGLSARPFRRQYILKRSF